MNVKLTSTRRGDVVGAGVDGVHDAAAPSRWRYGPWSRPRRLGAKDWLHASPPSPPSLNQQVCWSRAALCTDLLRDCRSAVLVYVPPPASSFPLGISVGSSAAVAVIVARFTGRQLDVSPSRRTSSTTTTTMHDRNSTPNGTLSHDKRSRHKSLTKTNLKGLLKFLAAVCVLEGAGASSTRELSTDTSSAQLTTIPGALASPSPEGPHPHPHPHPHPSPTDAC